jgi:predicted peroxiredoxin
MTGAQAGAVFGPWGAAIGAAAGALLGFASAARAGRNAIKEFAESKGGFDTLRKDLLLLGAEGERLWVNLTQRTANGDKAGAAAAIKAIEEAMAGATAAMEKYKIKWEELGAAARNEVAKKAVEELQKEWKTLTQTLGVSVPNATRMMAAALNEYIGNAIRAGVKIPAAMEPIIRSLIEQGLLTEENARLMLGYADAAMPALADIEAAAARYGLTLDQLGPKVQQLRINEMAAQLAADWKLFGQIGVDTNVILDGMAPKVQEMINMALTAGVEIPASMRPIIQALIEQGRLVDENGEKLTDLGRLTFAEELTTQIKELVTVLKEFVEEIRGGAVPALTELGRTRIPRIKIPYEYVEDSEEDEGGMQQFSQGTKGYQYFGAGEKVMLHGWEKVVPYGKEETGGGTTVVNQYSSSPEEAMFEANIHIGTNKVFKALVKGRKTLRLNR